MQCRVCQKGYEESASTGFATPRKNLTIIVPDPAPIDHGTEERNATSLFRRWRVTRCFVVNVRTQLAPESEHAQRVARSLAQVLSS